MQPFTITFALLVDLDACFDQRNAFASAFPDGLTLDSPEPDETTVDRIVSAQLDVDWFAQRALTPAAEAEYDRAAAAAEAEYDRARAIALVEFELATAATLAEYKQVRAAGAEYRRATAAALAKYQRARVRRLWKLLSRPENRRLPC